MTRPSCCADLVVSVGGVQLRDADSAMDACLTLSAGKLLDVVLIRNGVRQTLRVAVS